MKNYYLILGIKPDSTTGQVKAAYRQLAKNLHPDYYGRDSKPFLDLQEAYAVLSDPVRRKAYDNRGQRSVRADPIAGGHAESLVRPKATAEPLIPTADPVENDMFSLFGSFGTIQPSFDELFLRIRQNYGPLKPKLSQLRPLTVEIRISREAAINGGRVILLIPAQQRCPYCHGRGGIGFMACSHCAGGGQIRGEFPVTIAYPPGIGDNHLVQLSLEHLGITNFYLTVIFRQGR